jgi:hypothetical protein
MKAVNLRFSFVLVLSFCAMVLAQSGYERKTIIVPKVAPEEITIDGKMDEAAWQNAAGANIITSTGYEIYTNKYGRESLEEPDYDELYARMLWAQDTLYLFIHIDEMVNDSTNLFWEGLWTGDQLFISLTNRLGLDYAPEGQYNGNAFTYPDGPYYLVVLGDSMYLNGGDSVDIPIEYRRNPADTTFTRDLFDPYKNARISTFIDTLTGVWNIEMAIFNPSVTAQSRIGFNLGGSTGSRQAHEQTGDAYAYWTWQASVPDAPYEEPPLLETIRQQGFWADPGVFNLATTQGHAVLIFQGQDEIYTRKEIKVPMTDSGAVVIDGVMNESAWERAAQVNVITNTGYEIYTNKYGRESLEEPDYDELYARLLWSYDTLYAFIHIDEMVNDSTNLFWQGLWTGDQLFLSVSNRLGIDMADEGRYNGNAFTYPEGPYYNVILGDQLSFNGGDSVSIPEGYRRFDTDTVWTRDRFFPEGTRMAVNIDTLTGVWDIELAIYNPAVANQSVLGFNLGGSTGSRQSHEETSDAYAYWTWQASVPDAPYDEPPFLEVIREQGLWADPGVFNLATSQAHAVLQFVSGGSVSVSEGGGQVPSKFALHQNYPNPFNPSTTIKFDLMSQAPVTLKIYNILGQEVTTLINNQVMNAGSHITSFNAGNLSSGVYFYKLSTGSASMTRKMMLLK